MISTIIRNGEETAVRRNPTEKMDEKGRDLLLQKNGVKYIMNNTEIR